ncbi:MAG: hypothetical protein HY699_23025 [Deltaproteobacteria bacterium]|nr:hypothetical protein [Deltaproteobacteria bacterium]
MQKLLKDYGVELDENEVFRAMGYPEITRVSQPVLDLCRKQMRRVPALVDPWADYREVGIQQVDGDSVRLDSCGILRSRRVASMLRRARELAVCLVTLGPAISVEIRRLLADNCTAEALALDAAATAATGALLAQCHAHICRHAGARGCGTTVPYGPGYTGWDLRDLPVLFACLESAHPPVQLNQALMMIPEKSLLSVIGLVPGGCVAPEVVACRMCDLGHCSLRRAAAVGHHPA